MTNLRLVIAVFALIGACALGSAAADWQFKTLQAKRAVSVYQKETEKVRLAYERDRAELDAAFRANLIKLRRDLMVSLDAAKKSAMANQNLEEAVRIDETIKELKDVKVDDRDAAEEVDSGLEILQAKYGAYGGWIDVTKHIQAAVKDDRVHLRQVGRLAGWGDPSKGNFKAVVIMYRHNGEMKLKIVKDSQPFSLP